MITLEQISTKLDNILNGVDEETSSLVSPANEKYFFKVATEGLSFTNQNDMISGKNFIPVFVSSFGGEFNPVKGLGEANLSIQVQFYYQAELKNDFYKITEFLIDVFVGNLLTFDTQKAVCNIEPPTYGELQTNDITKFKDWVTSTYKQPIKVSSVYMTMTMILHISTAKDIGLAGGFMYGNSFTTSLSLKTSGESVYDETNPVFASNIELVTSTPSAEQILGTNSIVSLPLNTAYTKQLPLYVKNTPFYLNIFKEHFDRNLQNCILTITDTLSFKILNGGVEETQTITRDSGKYCISNVSISFTKGTLLVVTLTLSDRIGE